jgi:hypothetical protein
MPHGCSPVIPGLHGLCRNETDNTTVFRRHRLVFGLTKPSSPSNNFGSRTTLELKNPPTRAGFSLSSQRAIAGPRHVDDRHRWSSEERGPPPNARPIRSYRGTGNDGRTCKEVSVLLAASRPLVSCWSSIAVQPRKATSRIRDKPEPRPTATLSGRVAG